jgi:hypothetical protein
MPKKANFDTVWKIGLEMPEVEKSTMYGASALKVRGRLLACQAINKSAEPGTLAVCISFDQRDGMLSEDPATYYVTDHYVNYPCVLVRLSRIQADVLQDLLKMSWQFVTSKTKAKRPFRRRLAAVGKSRKPSGR